MTRRRREQDEQRYGGSRAILALAFLVGLAATVWFFAMVLPRLGS